MKTEEKKPNMYIVEKQELDSRDYYQTKRFIVGASDRQLQLLYDKIIRELNERVDKMKKGVVLKEFCPRCKKYVVELVEMRIHRGSVDVCAQCKADMGWD